MSSLGESHLQLLNHQDWPYWIQVHLVNFPTGSYTKKQPYMVLSQEYFLVISTHLRSKCHIYSPDAIWPFNYFAWKLSFFTCPSWDTFSQENYLAVLCVRLARAKNSLSFSRTEESCSVDVCRFCEGLGQGTTPDLKNRLSVYGKSFKNKEGREGLDCQGTGCRFRNLRS